MLYDLSPPITESLAVFPGDTPLAREMLCDMAQGDALTLSTLRATVHLGAHADAPSHYGHPAPTIDQQPLELYVGPCQVVTASVEPGARVRLEDLTAPITRERVLIRTNSFPDPTTWSEDFAGLEPSLVESLHERDVRLVGIDTPSVDLATSKELPAHHAFLRRGVSILEGLVLTDVPDGDAYELIAPPLRLVGFDASPVRAFLRRVE